MSNPWDRRQELGNLRAFLETIKTVLIQPKAFFDSIAVPGSLGSPFLFMIFWTILVMGGYLAFKRIYAIFFNQGFPPAHVVGLLFLLFPLLIILLITPFVHLFVIMFRGKGGFKGTFNICAY